MQGQKHKNQTQRLALVFSNRCFNNVDATPSKTIKNPPDPAIGKENPFVYLYSPFRYQT